MESGPMEKRSKILKRGKKDIFVGLIAALFITALILSAAVFQEEPVERISQTRILMGTYVTITVYSTMTNGEDAIESAFEYMEEVSDAANIYDEESEAYQLNEEGELMDPSEHLIELLRMSREYYNLSDGCFDITLAPLLDLWTFRDWKEAWGLFSISPELDVNESIMDLSDELLEKFHLHNLPIDRDAVVLKKDFGFLIHDKLFSINEDYLNMMPDDGARKVDNELITAFKEEDQIIAKTSELAFASPGLWNLTDGRKRFLLNHNNGQIDVAVEKYAAVPDDNGLNITCQFWDLPQIDQENNISKTRNLMGFDNITIRKDKIGFGTEGMKITLGGIAKGYAVDRAIDALIHHGIKRGLVNAGGDIATIGSGSEDDGWTVALENPEDISQFITKFRIEDNSICTSGNYHRYFDPQAKIGHIMDPRSGFTADECMSVTIISDSCTSCDVLATAVFVLGPIDGMELVESIDGVEALLIKSNKVVKRSSGLGAFEF